MSFWKMFAKQKAEDTIQGIAEAVINLDPETASKAQIAELEGKVGGASMEIAKARREYQREQQEADEAQAAYEKQYKMAEYLQGQIDAGENVDENQDALNDVITTLQEMKPEVEREQEEAVEAKAYLDESEAVAKELASQLKSIKGELDSAKRDMQTAEKKQQRLKLQQERQDRLKGLSSNSSSAVAVNAMKKRAEKVKDEMTAAETKNRLLGLGTTKPKVQSAAMQAAMQATGGSKPKSSLASLKL